MSNNHEPKGTTVPKPGIKFKDHYSMAHNRQPGIMGKEKVVDYCRGVIRDLLNESKTNQYWHVAFVITREEL